MTGTTPPVSTDPAVALTAHAIAGDRERFLAIGMDGYIPKPTPGDRLLNTIEELCGTRTANRYRKPGFPLFDLGCALRLMGGNQDIVDEICKTIIVKFPEEVAKPHIRSLEQITEKIVAGLKQRTGIKIP